MPRRLLAFGLNNQLVPLLIGAVILFTIQSPFFASAFNLQNLSREAAELGIVCMGATLVLLLGRLDISVGAVLGTSALIVILGFKAFELPWPLLVVLALLWGALVGAANGVMSAIVGIPSFIATLITLVILRGVMQWASASEMMREANMVFTTDESFLFIGNGLVWGIPLSLWLLAAVFLVLLFVVRTTSIGTAIYATGGNRQAAMRAGIRVKSLEIAVFSFAGVCSALGGVLLASRLDSVTYQTGEFLEFSVLVAVILGGTSIAGGIGGIWGTLLGVALMGVLSNGMVMMAVDRDVQDIVIALLLLFALASDRLRRQLKPSGPVRGAPPQPSAPGLGRFLRGRA